ncbi:hypothetical protein L917_07731 [Phytophthora nicotianae]|uniref:Uncharacterized protein n=1 Tax=Phytophthora nicotianae TaxID=4792 RepID=W2LA20_PHYNI|nr:hypothetical protein L917_07731 [Phytophthora nicotianae]
MWASFSRGRYFSAGNTTTNRVEANWNQLKMLLGYRPVDMRPNHALLALCLFFFVVLQVFSANMHISACDVSGIF